MLDKTEIHQVVTDSYALTKECTRVLVYLKDIKEKDGVKNNYNIIPDFSSILQDQDLNYYVLCGEYDPLHRKHIFCTFDPILLTYTNEELNEYVNKQNN